MKTTPITIVLSLPIQPKPDQRTRIRCLIQNETKASKMKPLLSRRKATPKLLHSVHNELDHVASQHPSPVVALSDKSTISMATTLGTLNPFSREISAASRSTASEFRMVPIIQLRYLQPLQATQRAEQLLTTIVTAHESSVASSRTIMRVVARKAATSSLTNTLLLSMAAQDIQAQGAMWNSTNLVRKDESTLGIRHLQKHDTCAGAADCGTLRNC